MECDVLHETDGTSDCVKYGVAWDLVEEGEQGRMQLSDDMCVKRHLICFDGCKRGVRNQNIFRLAPGRPQRVVSTPCTGKHETPHQLGHECVRGMA